MLHEYDEALRVGKVMDELDYYWYESPMPESDEYIAQYIELKKHIRTPLIGGETAPDAHEKRFEWLHAGATDWGAARYLQRRPDILLPRDDRVRKNGTPHGPPLRHVSPH
ncbi:MAG: enolase C-terminal domain-like protein [Candidatus Sumerlaeota bacterium]